MTHYDLNSRIEATSKFIMQRFFLFTSLLLVLATLDACVSVSDSPTLFVGMTRDRLKSHFGEPLRVERASSGGEDWYYSFASWRRPDIEASGYNEGTSSSVSVSVTFSDQSNTQDCPIHLSPDGYVLGPLPVGKIVRK
jgi:outer membrane protein assembly factor BamE (lipoprotein component of BamABCDE complex)